MISHLKHVICEKKCFLWFGWYLDVDSGSVPAYFPDSVCRNLAAPLNQILSPAWSATLNPMFLRAQTNQLFIIPIPGDPFALPSQNSDPIRGPIFVPLNTDCLRYIICFPIFHIKTYNCIVKFGAFV